MEVQVLSGHRYVLFADMDTHAITEFISKATVYNNLVPSEDEPTELNNFDVIFEQQPPRHEAKKEPPIVIGSDTIAPIMYCYSS